jgi:hypothetical protein
MTEANQLTPRMLEPDLLGQNYRQCLRRLSLEPADLDNPPRGAEAVLLPTTHTFGAFKNWDVAGKANWRETWKSILIEDRALLSDARRTVDNKLLDGEPRRDMPEARKMGLDQYVFAYLGVHDPHYAREGPILQPPFGVFISTEKETFPRVIVTNRDLRSPDAPNDDLTATFLLPLDGRRLAYFEAKHNPRHKGDFWHYWGSPRCSDGHTFHSECWKWFLEFHYHDTVPASDFVAILWPHRHVALSGGGRMLESIGQPEVFNSTHPQCRLIPYIWDVDKNGHDFRQASDDVARFFAKHQHFPEDAHHAKEATR